MKYLFLTLVIIGLTYGAYSLGTKEEVRTVTKVKTELRYEPLIPELEIGTIVSVPDCGWECTNWRGEVVGIAEDKYCEEKVKYLVQYSVGDRDKQAFYCKHKITILAQTNQLNKSK